MITLSTLKNTHRPKQSVKRLGRGMGSKKGKTCGKGNKGDKARQGYKTRPGYEGGQLPLYRKSPCRGFTNGMFRSEVFAINLCRLEELFNEGDVVNLQILQRRRIAPRRALGGLKILSQGEISKKLTIEATAYSKGAEEKLKAAGITYTLVTATAK